MPGSDPGQTYPSCPYQIRVPSAGWLGPATDDPPAHIRFGHLVQDGWVRHKTGTTRRVFYKLFGPARSVGPVHLARPIFSILKKTSWPCQEREFRIFWGKIPPFFVHSALVPTQCIAQCLEKPPKWVRPSAGCLRKKDGVPRGVQIFGRFSKKTRPLTGPTPDGAKFSDKKGPKMPTPIKAFRDT